MACQSIVFGGGTRTGGHSRVENIVAAENCDRQGCRSTGSGDDAGNVGDSGALSRTRSVVEVAETRVADALELVSVDAEGSSPSIIVMGILTVKPESRCDRRKGLRKVATAGRYSRIVHNKVAINQKAMSLTHLLPELAHSDEQEAVDYRETPLQ